MQYTFYIQDPTDDATQYFIEAIIGQVGNQRLESWRGIFAFATGNAVRTLFVEDPLVSRFAREKQVSIIVGLDAVTDVSALQELKRLCDEYENFEAKVFHNPNTRLFHPKISHFRQDDGMSTLIVGSGNLTPGGLRNNIEAYSVIIGSDEELASLSVWDEFLERHRDNIRDIDDEAFEKARQNRIVRRARPLQIREVEPEEPLAAAEEEEPEDGEAVNSRVLIARVPAAGGRWHQIHLNALVVTEFFRIRPNSEQRLFLRQVRQDGSIGNEEVRPLVYSLANRNYKIEVAARRGEDYPKGGTPPILVFREMGTRIFRYMLIMPGEEGYEELFELTERLPAMGKGTRRVNSNHEQIKAVWADCPL